MSNKEAVARCKEWGSDKDCKFFLTEADDAKARLEKSSIDVPSAPKTPVSRRTTEAMPTPNTGSSSRMNIFDSGARASRVSSSGTPMARRLVHADSGDGDLASFVMRLLQQDNIALKSSTESTIRHAIGDRIGKYEAALKNSDNSLTFAFQKLEELEGDADH